MGGVNVMVPFHFGELVFEAVTEERLVVGSDTSIYVVP